MDTAMNTRTYRIEHDLLGDRQVPAKAYYGIHTLRAVENFPISGTRIGVYPELVEALACVKQAAALANQELGLLDERRAEAIVQACLEVRRGDLHDEFVVDVIQGGAGTSSNMNANEVIANRGLELLGHAKGEYQHLHPMDHVNLSQSTNDVYPTAVNVALHFGIDRLLGAMATLRREFEAKAREFADVIKMGRTQLQDAVPMTLGQEFSTYAVMLEEDESRLREAASLIREINLPLPCRHLRGQGHHRPEPRGGHAGRRCLRAALRRAQARRGETVQDLQRPAPALERAARRAGGDQLACRAGRFQHHAGQGQSGDP
jgi:aspartate ammonia-lyase